MASLVLSGIPEVKSEMRYQKIIRTSLWHHSQDPLHAAAVLPVPTSPKTGSWAHHGDQRGTQELVNQKLYFLVQFSLCGLHFKIGMIPLLHLSCELVVKYKYIEVPPKNCLVPNGYSKPTNIISELTATKKSNSFVFPYVLGPYGLCISSLHSLNTLQPWSQHWNTPSTNGSGDLGHGRKHSTHVQAQFFQWHQCLVRE